MVLVSIKKKKKKSPFTVSNYKAVLDYIGNVSQQNANKMKQWSIWGWEYTFIWIAGINFMLYDRKIYANNKLTVICSPLLSYWQKFTSTGISEKVNTFPKKGTVKVLELAKTSIISVWLSRLRAEDRSVHHSSAPYFIFLHARSDLYSLQKYRTQLSSAVNWYNSSWKDWFIPKLLAYTTWALPWKSG